MESNNLKIVILIPVYNHPETIRDVVVNTMKFHPHVIVVDDGSDKEVSDILSGLDVTLIRHQKNMGKGAAIMTGAHLTINSMHCDVFSGGSCCVLARVICSVCWTCRR